MLSTPPTTAAPEPLDVHRWKHRLIVFALPVEGPDRAQLKAQIARHREGLRDRDLRLIDLSEPPTDLADAQRPENPAALRRSLDLASGFLLIGKDGGIKARRASPLVLREWFGLIDQMPMRRREMRRDATD